jgi:hypothetical protein
MSLVLLAALAAGCVNSGELAEDVGRLPSCTSQPGTVRRGVLIMAQAVPSAQWLPCIRTVPAGWSFDKIRPRDGEVTMVFDSDRDGMHASSGSRGSAPVTAARGTTPSTGAA